MKHLPLIVRTLAAWGVTLVIVFPLIWLVLTAFKTELQAISVPPQLFFTPTLENFAEVQPAQRLPAARQELGGHQRRLDAAWLDDRRAGGVLDGVLSHPQNARHPDVDAVDQDDAGGRRAGAGVRDGADRRLLDTLSALTIVFTLSNLPIMVWMLYSGFKDIPPDILEAARMDGANVWQEFLHVIRPLAMGTLSSTALLCLVLSWNEAFWSLNLSSAKAGTLATLIASYSSPEGLFWAKLSAASLMAIAPIVVVGWFSQKQLVQGLTFGAVK